MFLNSLFVFIAALFPSIPSCCSTPSPPEGSVYRVSEQSGVVSTPNDQHRKHPLQCGVLLLLNECRFVPFCQEMMVE